MATFKEAPEPEAEINTNLLRIFDELEAIVYAIDLETYEILYMNKHGKALWGDTLGKKCWETVRLGQTGPCPNCNNHKALALKDQYFYREVYQDPINNKWLDLRGHIVRWPGGREAKLGIGMDVTKQILLEKELEQREQKLRMSEDALLESEQMFKSIVNNAASIIYTMTLEGYYSFVSPSWTEALGHDPTEIEGRHYREYIHPEDLRLFEKFLAQIKAAPGVGNKISCRMKHQNGEWHWHRLSGSAIADKNHNILFYIGVASDITEQIEYQDEILKANQKLEAALEEIISIEEELRMQYDQLEAQEKELRNSKQLLENIIGFLPDATLVIDREGRVLFWNKALANLTGVRAEDVLGREDYKEALPFADKNHPLLAELVLDFDIEKARAYGSDLKYEGEDTVFVGDYFVPGPSGGKHYALKATPLYNTEGEVVGAIQSFRDITVRKEADRKLQYIADHDSLTGLYNRSCFEKELANGQSKPGEITAIMICDIDGLKLVNDTLGHPAGDKLLITCAEILRKAVAASGFIARIGGDEFCVILRSSSEKEVSLIPEKMLRAVEDFNNNNPLLPLSISYGITFSKNEQVDMLKLLKEAENKMNYDKLLHNQSAKSNVVGVMMKALEARDYITEGHADRLSEIIEKIAEYLKMPTDKINSLRLFARFHDIGKVGISDTLLFKPGKLSAKEFQEMQKHSEIGFRIAQSSPDLAPIADWILKHHEWWNGKGYPFGLAGEDIPLECRILAVADAYDSMSNDRPYRKALDFQARVEELKKSAGTQFDPAIVEIFLTILEREHPNFSDQQ